MGSEYYLADTKNKRILMMGKVVGAFFATWLRDQHLPFPVESLRKATEDFAKEAIARRYLSVDRSGVEERALLDKFAVKVWAFCKTADWTYEIRWDSHEYEDEFLPLAHPWDPPMPDPAWKTVGSWYVREQLDPDPLAEEMARLEQTEG